MRRLLLLFFLATPLVAQTEIGVLAGHARAGSTDASGTTLAFDRGRAYGVTIEENGLELAAMSLRYDGALRTDGASASMGSLRLVPISLTARHRFGYVYAGAGVAYVKASALSSADLDNLGIGRIDVKSKVCWLANAGIAVPLRNFSIVIDGRYFDYRPESSATGTRIRLDLKPVVVSAGIRWKL
jgi:opacity protein-like surface antigen